MRRQNEVLGDKGGRNKNVYDIEAEKKDSVGRMENSMGLGARRIQV